MKASNKMTNTIVLSTLLGALVLYGGCESENAREAATKEETRFSPHSVLRPTSDPLPEERWALSLVRLQAAMARGDERARSLGGFNRVESIVVHDDDVVLTGRVDPSWPNLDVDQLAVAARNAYGLSGYRGSIGCSIDPDGDLTEASGEGDVDRWRLHRTSIFGSPYVDGKASSMAARHIALDYELKRISAGLLALPDAVDVVSSFEIMRAQSRPCEDPGNRETPASVTHRFWFTSRVIEGKPRYRRADGVVHIDHPVDVQLQTEQELRSPDGQRESAKASESASRFAASITDMIQTSPLPRYAELVNDFRVIEVAKLLHYAGVPATRLNYLLHEHALAEVDVPSHLGGIWRQEEGSASCGTTIETVPIANGVALKLKEQVARRRLHYRGGVEADPPIEPNDFQWAMAELSALREIRASAANDARFLWRLE